MGDKEDAVAAVEAAFHDAHKSAEKALMDATQLLQMWLKAGREVGVHPNESRDVTQVLGIAIKDLAEGVDDLGHAHWEAAQLRDKLIAKGVLPQIILPAGGGGGKSWP